MNYPIYTDTLLQDFEYKKESFKDYFDKFHEDYGTWHFCGEIQIQNIRGYKTCILNNVQEFENQIPFTIFLIKDGDFIYSIKD
jgi:hypothetical protein